MTERDESPRAPAGALLAAVAFAGGFVLAVSAAVRDEIHWQMGPCFDVTDPARVDHCRVLRRGTWLLWAPAAATIVILVVAIVAGLRGGRLGVTFVVVVLLAVLLGVGVPHWWLNSTTGGAG